MIIDIHTHPEPEIRASMSPADQADRMLARADRAGVDQLGLLGVVHPGQSEEEVRTHNDLTVNMTQARTDRLFGLVFVNPSLAQSSVEREIDRCVVEGGCKGIKLELDVNCRDSRLDTVMHKAAEHRIPVLHHCWSITPGSRTAGLDKQKHRSEPPDIRDLALRFPNVTIIMAHLDGCGVRGVLQIKDLPNVVIDTSGSQPRADMVEQAVRHVGAKRVLYGSDLHGRGFASQLGRIYAARLTNPQRKKILHQNARRVFGLGTNN